MGTMTQELRKALRKTKLSHKEIERRTGVTRASIARFMARRQSLRMDKGDALAKLFGLVVTRKGK